MEMILHIRVERGDDAHVTWWATSPQWPGFTVAADTLSELRTLSQEAIAHRLVGTVTITEELVGGDIVCV